MQQIRATQHRACIVIQRQFRAHQKRKVLGRWLSSLVRLVRSARKIQRWWRYQLDRRLRSEREKSLKLLDELFSPDRVERMRVRAVVILQKFARGYLARRRCRRLREERVRQEAERIRLERAKKAEDTLKAIESIEKQWDRSFAKLRGEEVPEEKEKPKEVALVSALKPSRAPTTESLLTLAAYSSDEEDESDEEEEEDSDERTSQGDLSPRTTSSASSFGDTSSLDASPSVDEWLPRVQEKDVFNSLNSTIKSLLTDLMQQSQSLEIEEQEETGEPNEDREQQPEHIFPTREEHLEVPRPLPMEHHQEVRDDQEEQFQPLNIALSESNISAVPEAKYIPASSSADASMVQDKELLEALYQEEGEKTLSVSTPSKSPKRVFFKPNLEEVSTIENVDYQSDEDTEEVSPPPKQVIRREPPMATTSPNFDKSINQIKKMTEAIEMRAQRKQTSSWYPDSPEPYGRFSSPEPILGTLSNSNVEFFKSISPLRQRISSRMPQPEVQSRQQLNRFFDAFDEADACPQFERPSSRSPQRRPPQRTMPPRQPASRQFARPSAPIASKSRQPVPAKAASSGKREAAKKDMLDEWRRSVGDLQQELFRERNVNMSRKSRVNYM